MHLHPAQDARVLVGDPWPARARWSPIVEVFARKHRDEPVVPFAGLAEAYVASVFQRVHGLSLPHIRKALIRVQDELGLRYALAIPSRYTDGAKIRFDQAASSAPPL
jgi:hypothetical protein